MIPDGLDVRVSLQQAKDLLHSGDVRGGLSNQCPGFPRIKIGRACHARNDEMSNP